MGLIYSSKSLGKPVPEVTVNCPTEKKWSSLVLKERISSNASAWEVIPQRIVESRMNSTISLKFTSKVQLTDKGCCLGWYPDLTSLA
ncbi:hypothetical protein ScPMuIL_008962 [Solemya velum]